MVHAIAGRSKMITDEEYEEIRKKVIKSLSLEELELLLRYEKEEDEIRQIIKEIRC